MPASSSVAIVNMALQEMGDNTISALTDSNKRAIAANLIYTQIRDELIERFRWRFAIKRKRIDADAGGGRELLQDNFDDNSLDTSIWLVADAGTNVNEQNERMEIVGDDSWDTNGISTVDGFQFNENFKAEFTVEFAIGSSGDAMVGFIDNVVALATSGLAVWFKPDGTISFFLNGAETTSAHTYNQGQKYFVQILYTDPGWEVYVTSEEDDTYDDPVTVFDTTTDSTGPMEFTFIVRGTDTVYLDEVIISSRFEPVFEYSYRYRLPDDCLRVLEFYDSTAKYTIENNYIYTDEDTVYLKYIKLETDTNKYPPIFIKCMVTKLKSVLAVKLRGDEQLQKEEEALLEQVHLPEAMKLDAIERNPEEPAIQAEDSSWAREGR